VEVVQRPQRAGHMALTLKPRTAGSSSQCTGFRGPHSSISGIPRQCAEVVAVVDGVDDGVDTAVVDGVDTLVILAEVVAVEVAVVKSQYWY